MQTILDYAMRAGPLPFPEESVVEAHSLVSHDHLPLYLIAVSSLARFWTGPALVVHDDRTLTDEDVRVLRARVPGARIIRDDEANMLAGKALSAYPRVASLRAANVRIRQLVDYYLHARCNLVIGMDSDIVFLRSPDELVRWAAVPCGEAPCFRYSPEWGWQPKGPHWLPDALPGEPFIADICCGLVCAHKSCFFSLEHLEVLMSRTPRDILWHGRYVTQMFYSLLGARTESFDCLGEPYRSGRLAWLPPIDDRVICHYFSSHERSDARQNIAEEEALFRVALGLT